MWVSNIVLVYKVTIYRRSILSEQKRPQKTLLRASCEYFGLYAGFSFNLGWLTAASFVNISEGVGLSTQSVSAAITFAAISISIICTACFYFGVVLYPADGAFTGMLGWATAAISWQLQNPDSTESPATFIYKNIPEHSIVRGFSDAFAATSFFCFLCTVIAIVRTISDHYRFDVTKFIGYEEAASSSSLVVSTRAVRDSYTIDPADHPKSASNVEIC
jgi:hypothetical protein